MAFAFSTNSQAVTTTANPVTLAVEVFANEILVIWIASAGGTLRSAGTPTYNGVAMTQAGTAQKAASSPEGSIELWYLLTPATGTHDISVPTSGSQNTSLAWATFSYAAGKTPAIDVTGGNNGTSANPAVSVDTTYNGGVVVAALVDGLGTSPTNQTGTQINHKDEGAWTDGGQYTLVPTAGSINSGWTVASDDWGICVAAFKELSSQIFTKNTIARQAVNRASTY